MRGGVEGDSRVSSTLGEAGHNLGRGGFVPLVLAYLHHNLGVKVP